MADICGQDRPATDRVQCVSVVGLSHDRIDGAHRFHARLLQEIGSHSIGRLPHAQSACQQDRRLELAQLHKLGHPNQLAEPVADVKCRGDPIKEQITGVRQNGGDAGAYRVALS